MRGSRAAVAVVVAGVSVASCAGGPSRFERTVCGVAVDVTVDDGVFSVAAGDGTDGAGAWRLAWLPEDAWFLSEASGPLPLTAGQPSEDAAARITVPDGSCTGYLAKRGPSDELRVVGDSLVFNVLREGDDPGGSTWQGWPGSAFVALSDDPASSALDEVRGAVLDRPDALVLLYGANDAVWIAEAGEGPVADERRDAVAAAVGAALDAAADLPCTLVVTPSVGNTGVLDLGPRYAAAAEGVAAAVRDAARRRGVGIADWTEASAGHHLPDGTDGDWFPDGDEIHPNDAGRAALVDVIETAVERCPD